MTTRQEMEWRKSKILELVAQGNNQSQVGEIMRLPRSVVSDAVIALRAESKARVQDYLDDRLPFSYELSLQTLRDVKKRAYAILHNLDKEDDNNKAPSNPKIRMECLRLIADIESKIVDVESHKDAVKAAMTFAKNAKQQLSTIENKSTMTAATAVLDDDDDDKYKDVDVQNSNDQITEQQEQEEIVESDNDTSRLRETDGDRESGKAEDATPDTATDNTTEEDSRVF